MKKNNTKWNKEKFGKILIWIGVSAWVPYIILRIIGSEVSLWPFLAFHLTGIISGSQLRKSEDKKYSSSENRRKLISNILIGIGILAWAPYIYLNNILGEEVVITPFLITHLSGLFSGILVRLSLNVNRDKKIEVINE